MDEAMHFNNSAEDNGTIFALDDQDGWVQSLEHTYHSVRCVLSWLLVGVGLAGVVANVLVIMVFAKMGFSTTIHISYTALAVSDIACLLAGMMYGIALTDWFRRFFNPMTSYNLGNMVGGLPHLTFSRMTALITAWISLERCLCVKFPTKVKLMITRKVTKAVIIIIFLLGCFPMVLVYVVFRFSWQIDPQTNSTTLVVLYDEDLGLAEIVLFLFGVVYPLVSWATVTICTMFLVLQLKKNTKWKNRNLPHRSTIWSSATQGVPTNPGQPLSTMESHVTKAVLIVAAVFLLCTLPVTANIVAGFVLPGYSIGGSLRNLYLINGLFTALLIQLNSSVNIFVFAKSGKKFRYVLFNILSSDCCRN